MKLIFSFFPLFLLIPNVKFKCAYVSFYLVFETKQDGEETVAFSQWKDMPKEGEISFAFDEKPGEYVDKKTGEKKQTTYRNIGKFLNSTRPPSQPTGDTKELLDKINLVLLKQNRILRAVEKSDPDLEEIPLVNEDGE